MSIWTMSIWTKSIWTISIWTMSVWTLRLGLFVVCVVVMRPLDAAAPGGVRLQNPDGGAVRALVIGIDAYQHVRQLRGAVADARDIERRRHRAPRDRCARPSQ